jgi:hypothetical protein
VARRLTLLVLVVMVPVTAVLAIPANLAAASFGQGVYLPELVVDTGVIGLGTSCIDARRPTRPTGELVVVPGESEVAGSGERLVTYAVEVEQGLPVDPDCFARVVELTLADDRSWIGSGRWSMQRVDTEDVSLRVTLASPDTVDSRCLPLRTGGIFSCWNGSRAMVNLWRWETGASDFGDHLIEYRTYVINHEVGHGLGFGHVGCTGSGDPAPVMMQQSKTTGDCVPNGWPTVAELG